MANDQEKPTVSSPDLNALLCCPFCGADAEIIKDHHDYTNGEHTTTYQVGCTGCFVNKQALQCEQDVIDAWNMRAT